MDLLVHLVLGRLAALRIQLCLAFLERFGPALQMLLNGGRHLLLSIQLLLQARDFFLQGGLLLVVLSRLTVLFTFQFALGVLDVELGFDLGFVDLLAGVADVGFKSVALLSVLVALFLQLLRQFLNALGLLAFCLFELLVLGLVLQLVLDIAFKIFKFQLIVLLLDTAHNQRDQLLFVPINHLVVVSHIWVFVQLSHEFRGALLEIV